MAFGKKTEGEVLVFEYGCGQPIAGEVEMIAQMRARNRLWNQLVELDRAYRQEARQIITPGEEVQVEAEKRLKEIRQEIDALRAKIKEKRKSAREAVELKDLEEEIARLKEERSVVKQAARDARSSRAQAARSKLDELDARRIEDVKDAEKQHGLYWCNYDEVRHNYNVARQRVMKEGKDLQFHRWDGTGKVTIRYQYHPLVAHVFRGVDTRLQIDPVPGEAWTHPKLSVRRKLRWTKVRLRVGTKPNRSPIWAELPVCLHRPLPLEGKVCGASIVREKVGPKYRYKLTVSIELPKRLSSRSGPCIGIDIGWRLLGGLTGLRVAYWRGEDGAQGQVTLGPETTSQFEKLRELQGIRDRRFNDAKESLLAFLASSPDRPEWLTAETAQLEKWRSQARLARLVTKWERFSGDEEISSLLNQWLKKDRHLWLWQANLRDQIQRRRREEYRVFAAWVAEKYAVVCLEDFDLREVVEQPTPEEGPKDESAARFWRTVAACSELRLSIVNACRKRGARVVLAPPQYTTQTCHVCGHVGKFNAAASVWHRCSACGALWDQDNNAAINLLRWSLENRSSRF